MQHSTSDGPTDPDDPPPINPYAAPTTIAAAEVKVRPPQHASRFRRGLAVLCAAGIMIGCVIASLFANWEIETILVSGPSLLVFAIVLAVAAIRTELRSFLPISIAMVLMVIGTFLVIFLNSWSPGDAAKPVGYATVIFAAVIQAGWLAIFRTTQTTHPRNDFAELTRHR
jgi:hypothetical protein